MKGLWILATFVASVLTLEAQANPVAARAVVQQKVVVRQPRPVLQNIANAVRARPVVQAQVVRQVQVQRVQVQRVIVPQNYSYAAPVIQRVIVPQAYTYAAPVQLVPVQPAAQPPVTVPENQTAPNAQYQTVPMVQQIVTVPQALAVTDNCVYTTRPAALIRRSVAVTACH